MIQALQHEIEAHVDPRDLMHLTHDDLVYVAKCTAEAIRRKRDEAEARLAALENGSAYEYIMHEVASML